MNQYRKLRALIIIPIFLAIISINTDGQSLLWKISGEDLDAPSYLYGTIHVKDKRAFEFKDSVMPAFEKCNVTALEVDLSQENIIKLAQRMVIPDGGTLQDLFTPEEYNIIKSVVKEATGMDMTFFNQLKPIAILSLVLNFQYAHDVDMSVDEFFYSKAKEMNKKVVGIETFDEQLEILESIPNSFIIDYFKNIDQAGEDLEQIIILYQSANLKKLSRLMQKDKSMVMLQEDLVISRNIIMAERISELIYEQPAFIAVGAGHLPGKKGIIKLLINEGYRVVPVGVN